MSPALPVPHGSRMPHRQLLAMLFLLLAVAMAAHAQSAARGPLTLAAPVRIAAMPGGRFLVSDYHMAAIHVVARRDLSIERSIEVAGSPVAVAWGFGRIYVGNETKGQVEMYNLGGRLVGTIGEPGSLRLPNAIAVDAENSEVLVLDAFEKVVKVFSFDGDLLRLLIPKGTLTNPTAMTFDPARRWVLVSDFGAFADSVFAKQNALVRQFDRSGNEFPSFNGFMPGTTQRTFVRPQGLTLDGMGHLYVVDSYMSQVHVLDATSGAPLGILGGFGTGPGQLSLPLDVIHSPDGNGIYVTDSGNSRISTFPQWVAP